MDPFSPIRVAWVGLLLLGGASAALAATGDAVPPFRFYSVVDGMTQSEVLNIEQDQAGYLWFTTARGLNRYDGREFDHFTIANGLPTNALTAVHVDAGNTVWVGDARGGITSIQSARVTNTIEPFGGADAAILDIEVVGSKIYAVADGKGILEITTGDGHSVTRVSGGASIGATEISAVGQDIWVTSSMGLYRLSADTGHQLQRVLEDVTNMHADATGTIWAVDTANRIGVISGDKFSVRAVVDPGRTVVDIATDSEGMVWVATDTALYTFDASYTNLQHIDATAGKLADLDDVSSIFVDRENSVWLSRKDRLIKFLGDRFRHYRLRAETDPITVWSIAEDRQGRFWFGTEAGLLVKDTDNSVTEQNAQLGIPNGVVRDIVVDADGMLWFGLTGEGLYRLRTQDMTVDRIDGTHGKEILDIEITADGAIWFSTRASGIHHYRHGSGDIKRYDVPNDTSVYSLDSSIDGSIWYGADDVGLVRLTPNVDGSYRQEIFDQTKGLHHRLFNHIHVTSPDEAWVATDEGGLYQYVNDAFVEYGDQTPFDDQTVYLVEALENQTVIVGGEQGLYHFTPGQRGVAHYDQRVGFLGLETNVHATFVDSKQNLWIGTVDGATRMDTSLPMPKYVEPSPTIVRMETELDRNPVSFDEDVESDQLGIHVEYAAVSLLNPKGVEFSYKLIGADAAWGPATRNKSVSYPRLSPGSYEFLVRARYIGTAWSHDYASHRFTIMPYFWQKPWFVSLMAVAALFGIWAFIIDRTRNTDRLNATLRVQVKERTESIEMARAKLQQSNEKLSREIEERRKSDTARAEVEARFRRAFENAPIGMGLLDANGLLFDANPALKQMFWPDVEALPETHFEKVICEQDQERFTHEYRRLTELELENLDERLTCQDVTGEILQTVVNLSPVRSSEGKFLYCVLQVQDITEATKLTVQLEYQASYDELTGLLNRRAFETELSRAWEKGTGGKGPSFLMFMDLDQFKVVNDTSGHGAGDQLLRGVSDILRDCVRTNDIVARLGGDEFGIILWECPTEVASRIAETIRESIEDFRFHWDTETYRIGVSIGGLPIDPVTGDISELQQLADSACYTAKEAGRNRVHMVEGDKDSARQHRGQVRWVQRIREAMDNNRFAIYGQPIKPLDENNEEPERLEILLRLRDPATRKLIPPGAFLPAAERYGMSVELDEWVVRSLLDTLFVHQAFQAEQRTYWINLSGTSIGDKRFAAFLKNAIKRSPLPHGTINFEITETAVIRSIAEAERLMQELREMGCKFALDDFGSGLSSFGYLKNLPIDYLKIDGSFIRNILRDKTDRIFVKSIIDIANSLNIKTIAEFVENQKMLDVLRDLGADYAQGFHLGRPFVLAPRFPGRPEADNEPINFHTKAG